MSSPRPYFTQIVGEGGGQSKLPTSKERRKKFCLNGSSLQGNKCACSNKKSDNLMFCFFFYYFFFNFLQRLA
jgi:hypothetical protein